MMTTVDNGLLDGVPPSSGHVRHVADVSALRSQAGCGTQHLAIELAVLPVRSLALGRAIPAGQQRQGQERV